MRADSCVGVAGQVGFEGNEFYFKEWPELEGIAFEAATFRFDTAIVVRVPLYTTMVRVPLYVTRAVTRACLST